MVSKRHLKKIPIVQHITGSSNFGWIIHLQGGPKKSLLIGLEKKCLWTSKIFFDGVFLFIYSNLYKKIRFLSNLKKKIWRFKN